MNGKMWWKNIITKTLLVSSYMDLICVVGHLGFKTCLVKHIWATFKLLAKKKKKKSYFEVWQILFEEAYTASSNLFPGQK